MSVNTGKRISQTHWNELPMPNEVIDCIHRLACRGKAMPGLVFTWGDGIPIKDNVNYDVQDDPHLEDDANYNVNHDPEQPNGPVAGNGIDNMSDSDDDSYLPDDNKAGVFGHDDESSTHNTDVSIHNDNSSGSGSENNDRIPGMHENDGEGAVPGVHNPDITNVDHDNNNDEDSNGHADDDVEARMDAQYGPRTHGQSLRPCCFRDYSC
jgi:hypothetical protein